jgi:hypothetical protein
MVGWWIDVVQSNDNTWILPYHDIIMVAKGREGKRETEGKKWVLINKH